MKAALLCVVLFAALASVHAEEDKVLVLDEESFDSEIAKHPMTLVEFYAPWCGHCKRLAPEYTKASLELEGKNAGALGKVDCTVEKDLCSKYGVRGFPTLKLFRPDGSAPIEYDQGRTAADIVKYMVKQNQPAVTELNSVDEVKNFSPSDSVKIVAFVNSDTNLEAFSKVAKALRNDYSFGVVKGNADANANWKVTAPAVVVLRDFDEGAVTYSGPFDSASFETDLTAFIKGQSFPLVGEIGPHNYQKYVERGFNFVWVFINPESEEHKTLLADVVTPVAAQFRQQLSFVKLDGIRWAEHAKSFGLSGNTPAVVLEDRQKRKNFILDESKTITKEALQAHVEGVLAGTVQPNLKSEEIPADNSGPVKVIVGKTFESIVMDETKDVLVEFYAPWCGHCKSLTPKYEELGKMFADDATTVIAKIDATANDSPADITGFPTLIFYPAGNKAEGVKYNGAREAKDMADFVRANKGVKASAGSASAGHEEL